MKTILFIDNKQAILDNLVEGFELEGYHVLSANCGNQGIALANEFIPDLIVSEIIIGKMNGYSVLQELLDGYKTYRIPFIFSTTQCEKKDKALAFQLGADDYIVKPYGLEEMYIMVNRWIHSGSERIPKNKSTLLINS